MRKLMLLVSVLLLGACWAVAQDSSTPATSGSSQSSSTSQSGSASSQSSAGGQTSPEASSSGQTGSSNANGHAVVEGCLSGSSGNFTLTAKNGTTYQLTGDTAKLSEHVGHEVKITGTSGAASPNAGTATGTANGNAQTLEVSSVKHISKTCQNGNMK